MRRRAGYLLLLLAASTCCGEDHATQVTLLDGYVTLALPAGWKAVQPDKRCRIGPAGSQFVSVSYIELEDSATVDLAYIHRFVRENLKATKSEQLSDGRVIGHVVSILGKSEEDHQWNVAKSLDAHHIAVALIGMQVGADKEKIVAIVDHIARSVEFPRTKRSNQTMQPTASPRTASLFVD